MYNYSLRRNFAISILGYPRKGLLVWDTIILYKLLFKNILHAFLDLQLQKKILKYLRLQFNSVNKSKHFVLSRRNSELYHFEI